jgi:hypothetical protein
MPYGSQHCDICGWQRRKFSPNKQKKYKKYANRKRNKFLNSLERLEKDLKND